ncbi:MAG TPA: glycoside hydrolase family 20 zincin-like fold domain-containing protein, partial [Saprospiraceae bacterium]|nr:glycoside hydrolase family 20 zincin-like fold domain-containing protein [Saprospiraceae bacterium]
MKSLLLVLPMMISLDSFSQDISIIPKPVQIARDDGSFLLSSNTIVGIPPMNAVIAHIAEYLTAKVKTASGFTLPIVENGGTIQLLLNNVTDAAIGMEGYTLEVNSN